MCGRASYFQMGVSDEKQFLRLKFYPERCPEERA